MTFSSSWRRQQKGLSARKNVQKKTFSIFMLTYAVTEEGVGDGD